MLSEKDNPKKTQGFMTKLSQFDVLVEWGSYRLTETIYLNATELWGWI